jgi:hypothetical protein
MLGQEASQQGCADAIRSTSIRHMRRPIFIPALLLLASCGTTETFSRLDQCPPAEFGRPGWIRACAGTGGFVGGVVGGIVSVALLPVSYPLTLAAKDGLGDSSRNELLLWPVSFFAATGHFLLGAPVDGLDYVFRRAWVGEDPPANTYELIPMEQPMVGSGADSGTGAGAAAEGGGQK